MPPAPRGPVCTSSLGPEGDCTAVQEQSRSPVVPLRSSSSEARVDDDLDTATGMDSESGSDLDAEGSLLRTANRQQSLSEIKQAFSRMRDLSGLDVSDNGSVPCSRRISQMPSLDTSGSESGSVSTEQSLDQPRSDTSLVDPHTPGECAAFQKCMAQPKGVTSRPSIDLSVLDRGLAEIVSESMRSIGRSGRLSAQDVFWEKKLDDESKLIAHDQRLASERDQADQTQGGVQPEVDEAVSRSSSASSGMMTAHTSLAADVSPHACHPTGGILGNESPSRDEALTQTQSGRSWHTARDHDHDLPPLLASPSRSALLAHSKSRSTHDLASLASGKNLVDQMERTQGEGWWSVERPSLTRRASNVDSLRRRFGEREQERGEIAGDERLEALEKLARGSKVSHRHGVADMPSGRAFRRSSVLDSPGAARRRASASATPDRDVRPMSAFAVRDWPRTSIVDRIRDRDGHGTSMTPSARFMATGRDPPSIAPWRPSSVQPRIRTTYHGPRPSLVAGSTWRREEYGSRDGRQDQFSRAMSLLGDNDTPTKPGRKGLNKISPEIARRASCLTGRSTTGLTRQSDDDGRREDLESPIRVRAGSSVGACTGTPSVGMGEGEAGATVDGLEAVKARHALELDAILGALSGSKAEAAGLREEVGALKKALRDCQSERDVWRERAEQSEVRTKVLEGTDEARHEQRGDLSFPSHVQ